MDHYKRLLFHFHGIALVFIIPILLNSQIIVDQQWISENLKENALVFDQANTTYIFETDYSAEGCAIFVFESNITIDLNGHTITFNTADRDGTIGIYPCRERTNTELGADDVNYSYTATTHPNAGQNLVVKNGRIINGGTESGGTDAVCIGALRTASIPGDMVFENLYLETLGTDAMTIFFNYAGYTARNIYAVNKSTSTVNRHHLPSNIKSGGALIAYNNIVVGGNNGIVGASNSVVYQNLVRQSGFDSNGYSVHFYRETGCSTYHNLLLPENNRGVMHNAGSNHVTYGNIIFALEKPNEEYGETRNPTAIRMRYDADNNEFYDNTCLVIGGVIAANNDTLTGCSGVYLSNYIDMKNYIHDNRVWSIVRETPTELTYAKAISFEDQGTSFDSFAQDSIYNNDFRSNHYLISLAGFDGGCYQNQIINNSFNWISGDSAYKWFTDSIDNFNHIRPNLLNNDYATQSVYDSIITAFKNQLSGYISGISDNPSGNRKTFYTSYYGYDGYISIFDSDLGTDVSMETTDFRVVNSSGVVEIKIGHSLWAVCKDSNNIVISNKPITVSDNKGNSYSGKTNSIGLVRLELIDYQLSKMNGSININRTDFSDHRAEINQLGIVDLPADIKNSRDNPLIINFPGALSGLPEPPTGLKINR